MDNLDFSDLGVQVEFLTLRNKTLEQQIEAGKANLDAIRAKHEHGLEPGKPVCDAEGVVAPFVRAQYVRGYSKPWVWVSRRRTAKWESDTRLLLDEWTIPPTDGAAP